MTRTYRWGYSTPIVRLTEAQLLNRWSWINTHPELRRRVIAMLNGAQDVGLDVGIGEGARDSSQQFTEAVRRHNVVTSGGCCTYKGTRYALRPGFAHLSFPGSSNHDDNILDGCALAVDLVGWENHWFDQNCERFWLKNFGGAVGANVNGEEWHFQLVEYGNSRATVTAQIANGLRPGTPLLPGDEPPPIQEIDMAVKLVLKDVRFPHAVWLCGAGHKTWVRDGDAAQQLEMRLAESDGGSKPSPVDGFVYHELHHGGNDVIASYGPILGPIPDGFDEYGRLL